jgi:hypothetical protein
MSGQLWSLATIFGPMVLILVIGFALATRRPLNPIEKQDQADAVRNIYRGGDGGNSAPSTHTPPQPEKDG